MVIFITELGVVWQSSIWLLYFRSPKSSDLTREFSESLSLFSSIFFKPFMRSARNIVQWWQRRKKWELDSGSRFRFKTATTQRVYTILEIMVKSFFIEMTQLKSQTSEVLKIYWIKYIINGIGDRTTIIQIKDRFTKL